MTGAQSIRFDGRVALVTGAGRGLGRAYARELARRGAAVVVNDPGYALRGDDAGDRSVATAVVDEIRAAGGRAIADFGSVATQDDAHAMVAAAIDQFGALDIVVCNAGNIRHAVFPALAPEDLRAILEVHVIGSYLVTRAAWPGMAARRYGRIVLTTSQVGFWGKIDSVAYGVAKMGVIGLMHGMRLSAAPLGIKVNCISPLAWTRMGGVFPEPLAAHIDPERVAAAVAYLCSAECALEGETVIAGGGHFALARMLETRGIDVHDPRTVSAELVRSRLAEIADIRDPLAFPDALTAVGAVFERLRKQAGIT
jgi:NAD(P)-dependent dehydrogenase (short-subunit alcohol dehydrogenase family)